MVGYSAVPCHLTTTSVSKCKTLWQFNFELPKRLTFRNRGCIILLIASFTTLQPSDVQETWYNHSSTEILTSRHLPSQQLQFRNHMRTVPECCFSQHVCSIYFFLSLCASSEDAYGSVTDCVGSQFQRTQVNCISFEREVSTKATLRVSHKYSMDPYLFLSTYT